MHDGTLIVAQKNVVRVWYFGIGRQEMRSWVQLSQRIQNRCLAIAEANIPRRMAGAGIILTNDIVHRIEQLPQRCKVRLKLQELALLLKCIQRKRIFKIQLTQILETESLFGWPMRHRIFNYDWQWWVCKGLKQSQVECMNYWVEWKKWCAIVSENEPEILLGSYYSVWADASLLCNSCSRRSDVLLPISSSYLAECIECPARFRPNKRWANWSVDK